ncbi:L-aspartate oxidase [Microbacterium sp. SSM24]|uniref:L-aspartate oxidase n=1 Tax=Microbacterium sp. SSM24 TaxID=2991714 RepID=UPI002225BF5A|nr:L-aspartate oxidase [Microbacterium sp. SSM24]MCW3491749.1 L-aspartate oxidase [Microbacterium sp. SSM24]
MTTPVHAVVVGSGIAGLTVAIHAVDHGCRVTLVTKDVLEHANTRYAQGGIAGVMFDDDRVEDHIRDTLVAGAGLSDPAAVRVLAEEGPARIQELIDLGVSFDRDADGGFVKGLEAAHSYPRILHSGGDATGTAIEKALVARLRASDVRVIEHAFLVDLVLQGGCVRGVELLVGDRAATDASSAITGSREVIDADAVVLATGGAGELYAHSTNPAVATGDGIAAALRAGADVRDLEFFQFHPTVLPGRDDASEPAARDAFLVSEAVRGEGATLIDEAGRRFVFDVHPDGELAPRDVVARAIAHRMELQGGRPVLLDATHLTADADSAAFLARRFPTIDRAVRDRGLDWAREPIPVTPAAHYLMGGVTTDLFGRTTLPGLYAVGEVARTGVHGANRLASNSLLEGAVFGSRAGDVIAQDAASGAWPEPVARTRPAAPAVPPSSDVGVFSREALQALMWDDAGLVRDEAGLAHAARVIAGWRAAIREPQTEVEYEDENLLLVAESLVAAARARRESVGAHFRSDDPTDETPQIHGAADTSGAYYAVATPDAWSSAAALTHEEATAC